MRNLKKFLAVLVVVAMIASSLFTMTAFGAADASLTPTDKAVGLGLIQGGSDGVTDEYLNTDTQRIQTAIIYLRLLGLEDKAKAYTATTDNFADADLVKDVPGAVNLLAYLKANPQLGWVGDGTNFHPTDPVSGKALYKVMLTSLGYTQGLDFDYDDTIGFARAKGFALAAYVGTSDAVSNSAMVAALMEAVDLPLNGKTTTLAQNLVDTKVITADNASKYTGYTVAPVGPLAIASVKSDNLISLNVNFNAPIDATQGANVANWTVKVGNATKTIAASGITMSADKMTANILLASTNPLAQSDVVTVTYAKAAAGTAADLTGTSAPIVDTTVPTVKSVAVTGNRMLTVVYSEPVAGANYLGNYTIDGAVYAGLVPTISADGLTATVTLTQAMAAGTHNVVVKTGTTAVRDYAGIPVAPNTNAITVATDTTAPVAPTVVGDATQTKVVVQFSKAIYSIGSVTYGSLSANAPTVDATDKSLWTITWNYLTPLPAAPSTITFNNVTDMYGNTAATLTLAVTPVVDVVRPAFVGYTEKDASNIILEFSKDMVLGATSNFTLKDKNGNVLPITSVGTYTETGASSVNLKKMDLYSSAGVFGANSMADNGPYTLAITGLTDCTALKNVIIDNTQTLTLTDTTAPTFDSVLEVNGADFTQTIYVSFNEKLDPNTATTAANYMMVSNAAPAVSRALPSNAYVELMSDNKTVKITIPPTSGAYTVTDQTQLAGISVTGVKDAALNTVSSMARTFSGAPAGVATIAATSKIVDAHTIKVILDTPINPGSILNTDFLVTNVPVSGTPTTLTVTGNSYDGTTNPAAPVITLTTYDTIRSDGKLNATDTGLLKVAINPNANAQNVYGTKMSSSAANLAGVTLVDRFGPSVASATTVEQAYSNNSAVGGVGTTIRIKLSEAVNAALVATPISNNSTSEFALVIDGINRISASTITFANSGTISGSPEIVITTADTGLANKAFTVSFSPKPSTTIVDATGNISATNDNGLKAFSISGTIGASAN